MKRRAVLLTASILFSISMSVLSFMQAQAQIDSFTYFIPILTDDLNDMYDAAVNEEAGGATCTGIDISNESIFTTIVISVLRDDTIIYYDQWEDGLEPNLTSPEQATTQVWGDNDPTNGSLPATIPPNTGGGDTLTAGQVIVLQNSVTVPFDPANIFFDGGDKLTSVQGNLAVTVTAWPDCSGSLFAGAWELYPTERWGNDYLIPVGEDLVGAFGGFGIVGLSVQAAEDNTVVEFDLDGDNTFGDIPDATLNEGQTQTIPNGIQTGAQVRTATDKRIQTQILTGDPTQIPNAYEARAYTLIPRDQFDNDYIAPRSSDGLYWLHNPGGDITVVATDDAGTNTNIPLPAGQTVPFTPAGVTGYRFTANPGETFYGLATLDDDFRQDWGYSLQPVKGMTPQVLVGWGVGNFPPGGIPDANDSLVYVTALTDTNILVDFENDGIVDNTIPVAPLTEVAIGDGDLDMSGAFLFSDNDEPFISAWGQDQGAPAVGNAIDVGTNVVPIPSLSLQKRAELLIDNDQSGTLTEGDVARFGIFLANNARVALDPATISDTLSTTVDYIPLSTQVGGLTIADDPSGTPFPLDESGYDIPGGLTPLQALTVTFDVLIKESVGSIANSATLSAPGVPPAFGSVEVPLAPVARYMLDKRLIDPADGQANRGDVITYGITITSTGTLSITKMPLRDSFDESQLTFISAEPPQTITSSGVITWADLTTFFGPLTPNDVIAITVTTRVDDVPLGTTTISNTASVDGAEGADGSVLPIRSDETEVMLPLPKASYTFDKRLIEPTTGQSAAGETVTFGLTLTNTGALSITKLSLIDTYDPTHLLFVDSIPAADAFEPGLTVWSGSLVNDLSPFLPTAMLNLTVTYTVVDPLPEGVTNTTNTATVDGVQDSLGNGLPPLTDTAEVVFSGSDDGTPTPTSTPTSVDDGNNDGDNDDDDDGSSGNNPPPATPTPSPNGTPLASSDFDPPASSSAPPDATPPFPPVALLPETGANAYPGPGWGLLLLTTTILMGLMIKLYNKR